MISCREATRLLSQSMEHPLPLSTRVALKFHLFICRFCRRFGRDLRLLRRAFRRYREVGKDDQSLSAEARERMKKTLGGDS